MSAKPKKKYRVVVEEHTVAVVEVEASSPYKARRKAEALCINKLVSLKKDDRLKDFSVPERDVYMESEA